jgi:hypothetical protein
VLACPTGARLFGDVHDPDSEVAVAIRERGGYALMPEQGTRPANHYLPRRRTGPSVHPEDLVRSETPLSVDRMPGAGTFAGGGAEDFAT